jgi:DNA-binding response OmpR family regulator
MTTILVIDDDSGMRDLIGSVLADAGYRVLTASDGDLGLEVLRHERPDLVITVIAMPRKGGLETITEILRCYPDVKIMATSGGGGNDLDVLGAARGLGARDVLAKPFGTHELVDHVQRCLKGGDE